MGLVSVDDVSFSALILLVGLEEGYVALKKPCYLPTTATFHKWMNSEGKLADARLHGKQPIGHFIFHQNQSLKP